MARFKGKRPQTLADTLPPRLPWVLLCHASGATCGRVWTVNRLEEWRPAIEAMQAHERLCTRTPRQELYMIQS